jgi:hypothetical protein
MAYKQMDVYTLQHLSSRYHIITKQYFLTFLMTSATVPFGPIRIGERGIVMHSAVDDVIKRTRLGGSVDPREIFCTSMYVPEPSFTREIVPSEADVSRSN